MTVLHSESLPGKQVGSPAEKEAAIDRAWRPLLGACLCMFCGVPGVVYYTFGLFLPQIVADTGWSAVGVAAAIGPGVLMGAVMLPLVGRISDKYGVRLVALAGGPAFALGLACLGWASANSASFTAFVMFMYLLSFAGTPIAYAQMLTGWFDRRRGLALGIMFCAAALGIAAWPSYAAFLIAGMGWRMAYVVMGCTAGGAILFSALFLLRDAPQRAAVAGDAPNALGLTTGEALRTARFWKIAAIFTVVSAVLGGTAVQFPLMIQQLGAEAGTAAEVLSAIGIAMFVGRFVLGFILDRWFAPHVTIGVILVGAAAFAFLLIGISEPLILAAAFCLGFGLGSEYAVIAYLVSRAFGRRAYGAIYGLITLTTSVGMAIGPAALGISLVTGVAAILIFTVALALLAVAVILLLTLRRQDLDYAVPA